jgi:hypothetical protein
MHPRVTRTLRHKWNHQKRQEDKRDESKTAQDHKLHKPFQGIGYPGQAFLNSRHGH